MVTLKYKWHEACNTLRSLPQGCLLSRSVLDEDMMYDDKGFVLIRLYGWSLPLIEELRNTVDRRAFANVRALALRWNKIYLMEQSRLSQLDASEAKAHALPKRGSYN